MAATTENNYRRLTNSSQIQAKATTPTTRTPNIAVHGSARASDNILSRFDSMQYKGARGAGFSKKTGPL
jgi:hypothetical protein